MNRTDPPALLPMPDVQSAHDHREIPIDQVGIRGLRYPIVTGYSWSAEGDKR